MPRQDLTDIRVRTWADGATKRYQAIPRDAAGVQRARTFVRLRDAIEYRDNVRAEAARGVVQADARTTVGELLDRWLAVYDPKKESTRLIREQDVRLHLKPALGHLRLARLTAEHIEGFFREKKKTLKPSTLRRIGAPLQMALKAGVRWKLIPRSPWEDAEKPSVPKAEVAVWTEDQAHAFFAHHGPEGTQHPDRALWLVLCFCELRISEALALRWEDLDWERSILHVERTLTKTREDRTAIGTPKTDKSRRALHMAPVVVEALRAHRARQNARRLALGPAWVDGGWVFDNGTGKRLHGESARARFEAAQRAAGVPRITPHGLRHSGATMEARAGVPIHVLQHRLGHASPLMTAGTYSHHQVADQREVADAVAARVVG